VRETKIEEAKVLRPEVKSTIDKSLGAKSGRAKSWGKLVNLLHSRKLELLEEKENFWRNGEKEEK